MEKNPLLGLKGLPPFSAIQPAHVQPAIQTLLDQGYTLVDIRRPEEWLKTGVVKGSKLLTFVDENGRVMPGFLETLAADFQVNEPLILICRTGSRTRTLASYMVEKLGYTQVYNVRGGITRWIGEDLPVVSPR